MWFGLKNLHLQWKDFGDYILFTIKFCVLAKNIVIQ